MKNKTKRRPVARPVAAAGLLVGLLCSRLAHDSQAQIITLGGFSTTSASTSFQGQAAAISGFVMGGAVALASTGPLAVTGGAQEAATLEQSLSGGLSAGACHAAVIARGSLSWSEAAAANVSFTGCGGFFWAATTITADFAMSHATASCSSNGAVVSAEVEVTGLVINGQAVAVTGQANQMVFLSSGGWVIIHEQTASAANITVNALHLVIPCASVDVVIASSSAAITCGNPGSPPSSSPGCHFVTGGGWITGTPSGAKANFGVAGGLKDDTFWGHLNYIDHGNGMHVKATSVTGYQVDPSDPDCRLIEYNVTIDSQPGTARVRVCDKGEPGRNDVFEIQLSNGYFAGGDLGGSHPGGGNIQLHKCHD